MLGILMAEVNQNKHVADDAVTVGVNLGNNTLRTLSYEYRLKPSGREYIPTST